MLYTLAVILLIAWLLGIGGTYTIEGGTPSKSEHVMAAGVGDGEGFYTARRIWLAGISAQRGY